MEEQEKRTFHVAWYRLDGLDRYLLWWTSDRTDAVWVDANRRIPTFETMAQAQTFERQLGILVEEEEPELHNLDLIKQLLRTSSASIDCEAVLESWNFFVDVAEGTGSQFAGQKGNYRNGTWNGRVYDKLFFGTSTGMFLASPETPYYVPRWNKNERKFIAKVLTQGMKILRRHVYLAT